MATKRKSTKKTQTKKDLEAKIAELIKDNHVLHVRKGHHLDIKKIKKKS